MNTKRLTSVIIICLLFLLKCKSLDPVAYEPPAKPEKLGVYAENSSLQNANIIAQGKVNGLESLDLDEKGFIYGGDKDGNIVKVSSTGVVEKITNTGGRPLGIQFDSQKNLIIADAYKGLLSLSPDGKLSVLVSEFNGVRLKFTDDLDISKDGKIYFSDASIYEQKEYLFDLLESRPHGRVFVYDPKTKTTELLLDNLYFANGIALSKKEDFLLVNETYRYRISRYWLKGNKKGTREVFIDNLPGFPDNITANDKGEFYVALFTVRNDRMDKMHPSPFLKSMTSKLPKFLWPKPEPYGYVLKLNENGVPVACWQDPSGNQLKEITSAIEKNGFLYIGSLYNDRLGIVNLNSTSK